MVQTNDPSRRNFLLGSAAAVSTFFIGRSRAQAEDAVTTLQFATVAPPGTPWSAHLDKVRTRLKEQTGGRYKIKAYLGGALGDEQTTASRCRKGGIAGWAGTTGALAGIIPELAALELPYLFPDLATADTIIDRHVRKDIEAMLERGGFKLLFMSENGHRSIGTNFGFVKSPEDLKGKKIRVQPGDLPNWMLASMGASPQAISVTDVAQSLQTGVVDGFDNTPLFTFAASWYQSISHFTLTEHSYQPGVALMSMDVWKTIPADVQAIIAGDIQAESENGRSGVRMLAPSLIANFDAAGIKVATLTHHERAAFKKASASTHKKFTDKFGSTFYKAITKHL